ncbi:response regulator [Paraburkholderia mimosarum]|uniref:response regulator n=1 Tax=Paraburkholderia mimosarum TaxID=312026 RepID=UPI00068600C9|nr:response regulator [Paraburkholderia mimosarum]
MLQSNREVNPRMSRVLLADDDTAVCETLRIFLHEAGHVVTTARNGLEAVQAALSDTPDVIVSDVEMPILDGPDAVSMLRAIPRFSSILVILISGDEPDSRISTETFLRKPFDPHLLLDALEQRNSRGPPASSAASARQPSEAELQDGRIARAMTLVAEQESRVALLQCRGENAALASELYDALKDSACLLEGYRRTSTMCPSSRTTSTAPIPD